MREIPGRSYGELPVAVAAELRRLRVENARLLRLLELTPKQAAPPGPAQGGFFEAPPGPVHANPFDPRREAIFLVAGDKAGKWEGWYREAIPVADERFTRHLRDLEAEEEKRR